MKKFYANYFAIWWHLLSLLWRRLLKPLKETGAELVLIERSVFLFRTNKLTEVLKRNYMLLEQSFPGQVFVVADESTKQFPEVGFRVISLSPSWSRQQGLRTDGEKPFWLNGDYFYYRAVEVFPEASHFWLIDDDVLFNVADIKSFFRRFASSDADFIGAHVIHRPWGWGYARRFRHLFQRPVRCFFPVSRLSKRAAEHLLIERQQLSRKYPEGRWPNDEVFVASTLARDGFVLRDLNEFAHVYSRKSLTWKGRFSLDQLLSSSRDGFIYHSVK